MVHSWKRWSRRKEEMQTKEGYSVWTVVREMQIKCLLRTIMSGSTWRFSSPENVQLVWGGNIVRGRLLDQDHYKWAMQVYDYVTADGQAIKTQLAINSLHDNTSLLKALKSQKGLNTD